MRGGSRSCSRCLDFEFLVVLGMASTSVSFSLKGCLLSYVESTSTTHVNDVLPYWTSSPYDVARRGRMIPLRYRTEMQMSDRMQRSSPTRSHGIGPMGQIKGV